MNKLMAAYGTLRIGHGNWSYFLRDTAEVVEENDIIKGFEMRTFGGFPAIFKSDDPDAAVFVDVFDMSMCEESYAGIDSMEHGAGYSDEYVVTEKGHHVHVYIYEREDSFMNIEIPDGNWNTYTAQKLTRGLGYSS